jgi:hypothetical protein
VNRQLTLRLFGILIAAIPLALWIHGTFARKAEEVAADPQAFLAHQTAMAKTGFLGLYIGAVFTAAGVCLLVEITARIADWILPVRHTEQNN